MPPRKRKNDAGTASGSKDVVAPEPSSKRAAPSSALAVGSVLAVAVVLLRQWSRQPLGSGSQQVANDLLPTQRLESTWEVPEGLRNDLACNLFCVRNTTKRDVMIAELVLEKRKAAGEPLTMEWDLFVEDTCIEKCLLDHRKGTVTLGDKYRTVESLPAGLHEYFSCASGCRDEIQSLLAGSAPFDVKAAASALKRCGVLHVPLGESGAELVAKIRAAYDALGSLGGGRLEGLVDNKVKPLRSGREEVWLPHAEPFTDFVELLRAPGALGEVAWSFFNHSRIAVDHVNIVLAPGRSVTERQELHSDVGLPTEHLEVHIPLVNGTLPLAMGPTRFCPCTHGRTDLRDPMARSVRRYFASYQHCLEFENLSWIFHSGVSIGGASAAGAYATLYDADVYHQGLENVSPDDRPVLVVALTTSQEAVHERNYVKRNISKVHEEALIGFRSTDVRSIVQGLAVPAS